MKQISLILIVGAFLGALNFGCGGIQEPMWVIMKNKTNQDMHNFVLDYGSGKISYQIFTNGYTFSADIVIKKDYRLKLSYTSASEGGDKVEKELDCLLTRKNNGGQITLEFLPGNLTKIETLQFRHKSPSDKIEVNLAEAKKRYNAVKIGMTPKDAALIFGERKIFEQRKYTWGFDYGMSFKPECVELTVCFRDNKVVRVEIKAPYDETKKGGFIMQKGISSEEWDKMPAN